MTDTNSNKQKKNNKSSKKRRKQGRGFFFYGTILILILILVTGAWLTAAWDKAYEAIVPGGKDRPGGSAAEKDLETLPDVMTVLILGLDSRDAVMRADTIMLLTLNRLNDEINIISIPRDMRVEIPGRGLDKINHAYAFGEVGLTRDTVEHFLEIKVDYYMTTDFSGFKNIVDILGGIEYDVETKMRYYASDVTIELDPGPQLLDGDKALQYVRWRSDGAGDLGRVERQQKLLSALLEELIAFRNVLKLHRLVPELAENIRTDLELSQAVMLANKLKNIDLAEINTFTLPGRVSSINGISYVLPDEEEIEQLVERYVKGKNTEQESENAKSD